MDLMKPFGLCSGLKVLGYFMIVLVFSIIGLSYYAVVLLTCAPYLLHAGFESLFSFVTVILFHFLLVLLTWSYVMAVFQDPGSVPDNWKLVSEEDLEEGNSTSISHNLGPGISASTLSSSDGIETRSATPYCRQCHNGKPPRCHHCSICFYWLCKPYCNPLIHKKQIREELKEPEAKKFFNSFEYFLGIFYWQEMHS